MTGPGPWDAGRGGGCHLRLRPVKTSNDVSARALARPAGWGRGRASLGGHRRSQGALGRLGLNGHARPRSPQGDHLQRQNPNRTWEKRSWAGVLPGAPAPWTRGPGARGGGARDRAHQVRLAGRGAHGGRCVAVRKAEVARPATAAPRSGATRGSPSAPGAPPAPRTPHPPPRRSPLSQQRLPRSPLSPGSSGLGLF